MKMARQTRPLFLKTCLGAEKTGSLFKRLFVLLILLCLIFVFTSCSKKETKTSEQSDPVKVSDMEAHTEKPEKKETAVPTDAKQEEEDAAETDEIQIINAEQYFNEKGKIVSKTAVSDSKDIRSYMTVSQDLSERGFSQYNISSDYSMDGTYTKSTNMKPSNETVFPAYETFYLSSCGELWTIVEINGKLFANPVTYNFDSETGKQVLVSETDTIISYDNQANCYYETIPDESFLYVKKVERIDAETLDKLNAKELGNL